MLRPATPLAILLFAAFALLLLSVLSTPIIKAIPLGTYEDVNFGVLGYCKGTKCSSLEIGYDTCTAPITPHSLHHKPLTHNSSQSFYFDGSCIVRHRFFVDPSHALLYSGRPPSRGVLRSGHAGPCYCFSLPLAFPFDSVPSTTLYSQPGHLHSDPACLPD
jgi:hypothetical protein